jgi:[ribosomal protein S18]-alanine N-acetyltransferase
VSGPELRGSWFHETRGGASAEPRPVNLIADSRSARLLPLSERHLDGVLAIEAQSATAGWTRKIFQAELARPESRCYLVLELPDPHGVIAFGGAQVELEEAHITTLAVHAAHRRRGHATRLLVELLRVARARGARAATLEVRHKNVPAQRLYAAFGFRPVGVRPRYYEGADDALIMWAHDIDQPEYDRLLEARAAAGAGDASVTTHGER